MFTHLPDDLREMILEPCIEQARDDLWHAEQDLVAIEFLHGDRVMLCDCCVDYEKIVQEKKQALKFLLDLKS